MHENNIVGYSNDSRLKAQLAVDAFEMAVADRGYAAGVLMHSDRRSQLRSKKFVRSLKRHKLLGSMVQVGATGDNAAMESFFALLQRNVLDRKLWVTKDELSLAIGLWIERTYNRRRRQRGLGKLTPVEFKAIIDTAVVLAA